MTFRKDISLLAGALALFFWTASVSPAGAALTSASGKPNPAVNEVLLAGDPTQVSYSLANGFPLWYKDANGLKLELCLDQATATATGSFFPCLTAEPFPGGPVSFPTNFGTEAFWWTATAFSTFTSSLNGVPLLGDALVVMSLQAGFSTLTVISDGAQAAFSRIRLRFNAPVPGTYLITYPYGQATYVVTTTAAGREINQTQDVGNLLASFGAPPVGNFLLAMANGPDPAGIVLPAGFPAISAGIVSTVATGIGPFLVPTTPPVVATNGSRYLSDPGTPAIPLMVPVTGGPNGNVFTIRLTNPPAGFFLNATNNSQDIVVDKFQVIGKIFNDGPNLPPVANPDFTATAKDTPVSIDVLLNDVDVVGAINVHGIHPQAIGLPSINPGDPPGTILIARPLTTAKGGGVRRFINIITGRATFIYTPPPGFTGIDTFDYVMQDRGGLISAPATVTVTVEEILGTRAEYRGKQNRWNIQGTSSNRTPHTLSLFADPRASLGGASAVPAVDSPVQGQASLTVTSEAIDYEVFLDQLPVSDVTAVNLHVGAPGTNGPVIFTLFDRRNLGQFISPLSGRLAAFNLQPRTEVGINSFSDAVIAILSGNTYVNILTSANPGGEVRGQFFRPLIATAAVGADGSWSFKGKSRILPARSRIVTVTSENLVPLLAIPLKMK